MSERVSGTPTCDQLHLPIEWWRNFAYDSEILELESTVDMLSSAKEHKIYGAYEKEIRETQIELAKRALSHYGVNKTSGVKPSLTDYGFGFKYLQHHVETNWFNNLSVSVKAWDASSCPDGPSRIAAWGI